MKTLWILLNIHFWNLVRLWKKDFSGFGIFRKYAIIPNSHAFMRGSTGESVFVGNITPPTSDLSGKKIVVLLASQIS